MPAVATIAATNETVGAPTANTAFGNTLITDDVDLAVSKSVSNVNPTVGGNVVFTVGLINFGPNAATGVTLTDLLPSGYTYVSSAPSTGSYDSSTGLWTLAGTLANGASASLTITATVLASGNYTNIATLTSSTPPDLVLANNTASASVTPTSTADLAVTKVGPTVANRNTTISYAVLVSNAGPAAADNAVVKDPAVANFTATGVTCGSATGGAVCPTVPNTTIALLQGAGGIVIPTLPSGGSLTFTVTGTTANANVTITNVATVTAPAGITDPNATNNSSTDTTTVNNTTLTPVDLAITKTGPSTVAAGGLVTYILVATNNGPNAANNATVIDVVPSALTATTVTCGSPTGGAACPTVGNTTIVLLRGTGIVIPTLPSGGSVTFTVTGTAPLTATNFSNVAQISPPIGRTETIPGNNIAGPVVTTVVVGADLAMVKSGPISVLASTGASYSLVVTNNGPAAANNAVVTDPVVANFTATAVICGSATGSAVCPTVGNTTIALLQGNGIVIPTLPNGGSVTFTVSGTAGGNVGFTINNVATVTPPAGVTDSNPANNSRSASTRITGVTQVLISRVRAYMETGKGWVEWETASEIGTAGFNLLRADNATGGLVRLNSRLLPSLTGAPQGGVYRFPDPAIVAGGTYIYGIEEVEATGGIDRYGPFTVTASTGSARGNQASALGPKSLSVAAKASVPRADGFERTAHPPNGRAAEQPLQALQLKTAKQGPANTALRILVEQDGVYTLDAGQIASALGVSLKQARTWIGHGKLRLQQKGQQVSWMAGSTNDNLYFYGQAIQGTDRVYTRYNVYWLDQANGQTMNVVNGNMPAGAAGTLPFQSLIHAEENVLPAAFLSTSPDADFWYWNYVVADDPDEGTRDFPVSTPAVIRSGTATLSATLQGAPPAMTIMRTCWSTTPRWDPPCGTALAPTP